MTRTLSRILSLALLVGWSSVASAQLTVVPEEVFASVAQPRADTLAWELVGQTLRARGLFAAGVEDDLAPAVYANGNDGLFVIHPGEEEWTVVALRNDGGFRANDDVFVSHEGTLFGVGFSSIQRSPDGGQTWVRVLDGGYVAPIYTPAGALICNLDGDPTETVARSTDDGLTWTTVDMAPTLGSRFLPITFAALPASAALPGGRIVAGGNDGMAYSDDDGFSWAATNVYGAFAYRVSSVVRAPWGGVPDGPERETLYAAVNDFAASDVGGVWESADGVTWVRRGRVPGGEATGAQLVAVGDATGGVLYAIYLTETEDIQVYVSRDRGETWAGTGRIPAEEAVGNAVKMEELVVGPEGRLWLGMNQGTGGPGLTGGVFRTAEPVVAVSAEDGPEPGKPAAELGAAYPNPSSGAVTVPIVLAEPAELSVSVFDVLGREVTVLHEGPLAAGRHEWTLDSAALPVGVYIVRAEGEAFHATRRVTVLR